MKQFAKKFTAAMLAAIMAGTAPGATVFADSMKSSSMSYDGTNASDTENTSGNLITDSNAVSDNSSEETVSSSSSAITEKKTYEVSASGFVDDKYEMTAEAITDKDILSEIEKLMDGREILAPLEISVSEGTVEDAEKGVRVTLHDVGLTDAENLVLSDTNEIGLYHIEDFTTDSPKIERIDYERKTEPSTEEDEKENETITFTTKSFSPFIFAKMTDAEIAAEKEKKEEKEAQKDGQSANVQAEDSSVTEENNSVHSSSVENANTSSTENPAGSTEKQEVQASSTASSAKEAPTEKAEESVETVSSSSNAAATEASKKPSLMTKIKRLLKVPEKTDADGEQTRDLNITDLSLSASVSGGAQKNEKGDYVWTPGVETDEADHPYIYKVTYKTSGAGFYAPGEFQITIPKSLLKDREGNAADTYDMSIPEETETGLTDDNPLVYREDGDNIVIVNRIKIPAAQNGYVEIAYHTSEKTWEYADYAPEGNGSSQNGTKNPCSDAFAASFQAGDKTTAAEAPAVYMDTQAEITSTEKEKPSFFKTWQNGWGTVPSDADQYYYLVWNVRTYIEANQPYVYSVTDAFDENTDGSFVGVRYAEESSFTGEHSISLSKDYRNNYRIDTVLTKLKKSTYEPKQNWTVYNTETASVTPSDKIDAATKATAKQSYYYEKPVFKIPIGHFYSEKFGLDYKGNYAWNSTDLAVMDDENDLTKAPISDFLNGDVDTLGSFSYSTYANGYPYPWTLEDNADAENWENYGKVPITYSLYDGKIPDTYTVSDGKLDGNVYLYDSANANDVPLVAGEDYIFNGLRLSCSIQDAKYNEEMAKFDSIDGTYTDSDSITLSVLTKDAKDYITAGSYNLKAGSWSNIDSNVISADGTNVSFVSDNIVGMRLQTTNAHYYTIMYMYPSITLKNTQTVLDYAKSHESLMILRNRSHADMRKYYGTEKENTIINLGSAGTDYAGKQKHAGGISKNFYSYTNDKKSRILTVKWDVLAYERNLTTGSNVSQKSGVFYDLLPLGSTYKADSVFVYADGVKLKDGVYTVEVTDNYKNSGRTLLTVRMGKQANQYEMRYESICTYDDLKDFGSKMRNSVAYETGNNKLGYGRPDDGGTITDNGLMKDLDPDTDAKRFIYTDATKTLGIPVAANLGLYKKIKAEKDSNYKVATVTRQDSSYSYKMRFATDDVTTAKDLILYDSMENYKTTDGKTSDWYGILQSIDVSQPEGLGIAPVVYYSTVSNPDTSKFGGTLDASLGWSSTKPSDASKITAIAIDCRKDKDGKAYTLPKNTGLSVVVNMKSPKAVTSIQKDPTAYNNVYLYSTVLPDNGTAKSDTIHQDYTSIQYRAMGDVLIHKINSKDQSAIEGIGFTLTGTSDYGTDVAMTKTTNVDGDITFEDIEKGTYVLQETGFLDDYLKDDTRYTVTIDASGKASIKGLAADTEGRYTIQNSPRIHGDLFLVKKGTVDGSKSLRNLTGTTFKLYGTSDYGNEVLMYAESNKGDFFFKNIEKGTYTLVETKAADGYILPKNTTYRVVCDDNGNVGVQNQKMDTNGRYVIKNEPYHSLTLLKESDYDNSAIEGAEFSLKGTSDYGTKVDLTETSAKSGLLSFTNLEPGTYVLMETKAPDGFHVDSTKRAVVIQADGTTTVEGLKEFGDRNFIVYNQKIPTDKVVITKKWKDGLTGDAAANRAYPNIHIASYDKDKKISIPVTTEWNGLDGQDLTIHLMNGSTEVASAVLNSANNYKTTFTNLLKWDANGNAVKYELTVDDLGAEYITNTTGNASTGLTITIQKTYGYAVYVENTAVNSPLYFIRSTELVPDKTIGTITSISGESYIGKIYANIETIQYSDSLKPQWQSGGAGYITGYKFIDPITPLSCSYWFDGLHPYEKNSNLYLLNTSHVTNMSHMFSGCNGLTSLDVSHFDISNVKDMSYMFSNCNGLTSLDVSHFDTSNVKDMSYMFSNCVSLTSLDVSHFDTSNVKDMSYMFLGCGRLTGLDLSSFNTSNVTSMNSMFSGCNALTGLDLSSFNTSNVTSMNSMFSVCINLTSLDLSSFDTSNVTSMKNMFFWCYRLTGLDVSSFNTSNVTSMDDMFAGCKALTTIYCNSDWNNQKATNCFEMFYGCDALSGGSSGNVKYDSSKTGIEMANPDTGYFTRKTSSAKSAILTSMKSATAKVTSIAKSALNAVTGLKTVEAATESNKEYTITYKAPEGKFSNGTDTNTVTYQYTHHDATTTKYVSSYNMDDNGFAAWNYDINCFDCQYVRIPGAKKLTINVWYSTEGTSWDWLAIYPSGIDPSDDNYDQATISGGKLGGGQAFTKDTAIHRTFTVDGDMAQFYFHCDKTNGYYGYYAIVTDEYDEEVSVKNGKYEVPTPNDSTQKFIGWYSDKDYQDKIEDPSTLKTNATVYAQTNNYQYSGTWGTCEWGITADGVLEIGSGEGQVASYWNQESPWATYAQQIKSVKATGKIVLPEGSGGLFKDFKNATNIDCTQFDTSKVVAMSHMFEGCSSLKNLDLSSFNTSKVKYMDSMFENDESLTDLDISNFDTTNCSSIDKMFSGCENLLTIKGSNINTTNVSDLSDVFDNCQKLKNIDVSKWDTSNVQALSGTFSHCESLETLDVSNWNVSKVRSLRCAFFYCKKLKTLDVAKWNITDKVYDNYYAFGWCESLESLDLSNWVGYDTYPSMLDGCTSLKKLTLSSSFEVWIPDHEESKIYTAKWAKNSPFNHTEAISTEDLNKRYYFQPASPETATWYWEQKGEDPYAQSEQSADGIVKSTDSSGTETTTVNVYDPQTDTTAKFDSFVDSNGDHTGYWTKLSDDTWTYTFYVYDANVPWHVWEDELTGYTSSNTEKNPLILDKDTHDGTITNRSAKYAENNVGTLTLTKRAVDSTGTAITTDESFRFVITLTQDDGTALSGVTTFGSVPFHDGKATVTMTAGQTITMTKIPAGTHYDITETSIPDGYKQTAFTQSSGTIQAQSKTEAVCTNTKDEPETPSTSEQPKTGGFTLTKSCSEDTASAFIFHVSLTGLGKNRTYSYGTAGIFTSDDSGMADATLSLKDGESVTFAGLPIGATYQITEDANACVASFRVTDANDLGLIATNKKENTEVQTALSTAKESVDDGENVTVAFTNRIKTFPISILKQDPDGGFVTGAVLQIKKGDTVVHEWTTADSEEEEANLAPGEYVLHEKEAPQGFNLAEDIAFTVDNDGNIRMSVKDEKNNVTEQAVPNIVMVDTRSTAKISIRKTDGRSLISGAKLQILDDAGTVVDEWTSDGTVHGTDLTLGKTYTLHEKEAPAGYDYAEDIVFTVPADSKGEVIINNNTAAAVTMVDTPLATLPNTGATSDPWWMIGAVGCGLIFADQYRKKKERKKEKDKKEKIK